MKKEDPIKSFDDLEKIKDVFQSEREKDIETLQNLWRLKNFRFIASAVDSNDGKYQLLKNIRKMNGERITYPNGKEISINVPRGINLETNDEYQIAVFLAPDDKREKNRYKLWLNTKYPPKKYTIPPRQFVNTLKEDLEKAQGIARDTLIGAGKRLAAETNKKAETFVFELIQNADDYPATGKKEVHVTFTISDGHLVVTHDGLPFQQKNVYAICTIDGGDKKHDINKTGYKGIGFKSIFKFSNHVWINSGDYSFKFDEGYYAKRGTTMPWQFIPIWTEPTNVKPELKDLLDSPVSIFIRPTAGFSKLVEIEDIFRNIILKDNRVLLFLRHVKSISFKSKGIIQRIQQEDDKWEVSDLKEIVIDPEKQGEINLAAERDSRIPDKFKNLVRSKVTFATLKKGDQIEATTNSLIYAYLPTDWNFGFKFLINGDFIPDGSRDRLFDDIEWNLFLFENTAYQFLLWLKELVKKYKNESPYILIPILPKLISIEHDRAKLTFLQKFKIGFDRGISSIEFLRSRSGTLHKLSDLVIDKTGISVILNDIEIKKLISDDQHLLDDNLAQISSVRELFDQYGKYNKFDWVNLQRRIDFIGEWLRIPENNARFINLISGSRKMEMFLQNKVFLDQNNQLQRISQLYLELPDSVLNLLSFVSFSYLHPQVKDLIGKKDNLGFKYFTISSFIESEIVGNQYRIREELKDVDNSNQFYEFLSKNQGLISDTVLEKVANFSFHDFRGKIHSSIKLSNLYHYNSDIEILINSNCFASNQIVLLPEPYKQGEGSQKLWNRFGAKLINETNIGTFIRNEVCSKLNRVNDHLRDLFKGSEDDYKKAINGLIHFLEEKRNLLSQDDFKSLANLSLFLDSKVLLPCPSKMSLYFENETLDVLIDSRCLPLNLIFQLPSSYIYSKESKAFWSVLGVKSFDQSSLNTFFGNEVVERFKEINFHLTELHKSSKDDFIIASRVLLEFYSSSKSFLTPALMADIKFKLSNLVILDSDGNVSPISSSLLPSFYTNKTDIEDLKSSFPHIEISSISSKYAEYSRLSIKEWQDIFIELGAQNDNLEFIKSTLLPNMRNISKENIVKATRLLFENWKVLETEIQNFNHFRILTRQGEIVKAEDAIIGEHFYTGGVVKKFIAHINLENEISPLYAEDKLDKWTEFFHSVGVPEVDDDSIVSQAIETLLENQDEFEENETHHSLFKAVLDLHKSELLSDEHYELLNSWRLKSFFKGSEQTSFVEANTLLFSNAYNPKIRFEDFSLAEQLNFLHADYLTIDTDSRLITDFLKKTGVRGAFIYNRTNDIARAEIPKEYISWIDKYYPSIASDAIHYGSRHKINSWIEVPFLSLILDSKINLVFWENVKESIALKNALFKSVTYKTYRISVAVESEPLWFLKTNKTIPNLKGELCFPDELYDISLKNEIKDDSLIAAIDFKALEADMAENIAALLGVKTELDFMACLSILKRKESHNWLAVRDIFGTLKDLIDSGLLQEEQEALNEFNENGELLSQTLQWVPIDKLHVVDSSFKLGISKSPYLLHADIARMHDYFKIKLLGKDNFNFDPIDPSEDRNLLPLLKQRAKYLAFLLDEKNWEERTNKLLAEIEQLSFYSCKKISLSYLEIDPPISNSEFDFYYLEDSDKFYFIGRWDRIRAAEMYPELYKRLELKDPVSEKVFKDILFAENHEELLELFAEHKITLPQELDPNAKAVQLDEIKRNQIEKDDDSLRTEAKPILVSMNDDYENIDITPFEIEPSEDNHEYNGDGQGIEETINRPPRNSEEYLETTREQPHRKSPRTEGEYDQSSDWNNDNARLSRKKVEYSPDEEQSLKQLMGSEISDDDKFNENLAAHIKGLHYFKLMGYDVSDAENNFKSNLGNKLLRSVKKDGVSYTVMCRSARRGVLYLGAYAWLNLQVENTILYILTGNNSSDCKIINNQIELRSGLVDYWVIRRDVEQDISKLTTLAKAEDAPDKLQFLFSIGQSSYSGIFHKYDTSYSAKSSGINEGNPDI